MPLVPPQALVQPDGKVLEVVHSFSDGGEPAVHTMVGGQKVLMAAGTPSKPDIFLTARGLFVYRDGTPIQRVEDIGHIPPPFHAKAQAQLDAQAKGRRVKAAPVPRPKIEPPKRPVVRSRRDGRLRETFDPRDALGAEADRVVKA